MKRIACLILALALCCGLCACSKTEETAAQIVTPEPTQEPTAQPTEELTTTETPSELTAETGEPDAGEASGMPGLSLYTSAPTDEWSALYRDFLSDSFDVIAALWPDGISGIGFIDLDLDGTPEMLLFDMGASAAMGVQFFDIVNGSVVCVSSVNEGAAAAFGGDAFSGLSVCAQLFGDFRLVSDGEQTYFTVHSANGTADCFWDEIIRFDRSEGDCLTLRSVCRIDASNDTETNTVTEQSWSVGGEACDEQTYTAALEAADAAADLGYEAFGVFQWNDMERYDTSLEGLLVMLDDAVAGHALIAG